MKPLDPAALAAWLDTVQNYHVNRETAARIGAVASRLKEIEPALGTDSMFWTEPAMLNTQLNKLSPTGSDNE